MELSFTGEPEEYKGSYLPRQQKQKRKRDHSASSHSSIDSDSSFERDQPQGVTRATSKMTALSGERTEWSDFPFCSPFVGSDKFQQWHASFVMCMQELFGIIKDEKAEKEAQIASQRQELNAEQSKNKVIGALNKKLLERVGKLELQLQ